MFPLVLNLKDRLAVVVGGGAVGRRRASSLIVGGARVRLVCLEPRPTGPPAAVEWLTEPYPTAPPARAALAFPSARPTPGVNRQVLPAARRRGVWVNDAHDPARGAFLVPAVVRQGDFLIAVSTGGAAPGLARAVRSRLEGLFDEAFGRWAALLA